MRFLEQFCWMSGIFLLGWFFATETQAHVFQKQSNEELQRIVSNVPLATAHADASFAAGSDNFTPGLLGRIEIPRLKISSVIEEGDDPSRLRVGVGHVPGSAFPGEKGNVVLAAHRDTYFRNLGGLKDGDVIVLTTPRGTFSYRVETTGVVSPDQTSVLRSVGVPELTLITCYPFSYIGSAPSRYIVTAFRSDNKSPHDGPDQPFLPQ